MLNIVNIATSCVSAQDRRHRLLLTIVFAILCAFCRGGSEVRLPAASKFGVLKVFVKHVSVRFFCSTKCISTR